MSVLLLKLAAPMQAWGDSSRFARRATRHEPTKSGVLGLLAAALGRRRTDPVEDLAALRFGVRVDQQGQIMRDFQTARSLDGTKVMPLSYRYYLSDAVFLAGVQGDSSLLQGIDEALRNPVFPLYLGRRSCPPSCPPNLGVKPGELEDVLRAEPWHAAAWYRRKQGKHVDLPLVLDASSPSEAQEVVRDIPVSFSPVRREYGWRSVRHAPPVKVTNEVGRATVHDPMSALGGA